MKTLIILLLCVFVQARAQRSPQSDASPQSLVHQMKDFEDWRQTHNVETERGWKYYKRWEHEQLMHLDGSGSWCNPDDYMREILKAESHLQLSLTVSAAQKWRSVGPSIRPDPKIPTMQNGLGRVNCIAFDPNDSLVYYVGVAQGGVWKTTDDGATWTDINEGLPILRVSDIAVDPNNPDILYAAIGDFEYIQFGVLQYGNKRNTYFGMGLFKSTNGGISWSPTGLSYSMESGESSLLYRIIVHPSNSNKLIAAGLGGIFTSNDAGAQWRQVTSSFCWDLVADPVEPNTVYSAGGFLSRSKIGTVNVSKSYDYGAHWTELTTNIPKRDTVERTTIAIAPSDHNVVYALCSNVASGLHALYRSTDAGATWNKRFDSLNILEWSRGKSAGGQATYDMVLQVHATDPNTVYAGGVNLWMSTNGGLQFHPCSYWTSQFGPSMHADLHRMQYAPLNHQYYICNDGGVTRSKDISATPWKQLDSGQKFRTQWTEVTKNMAISSFYRISSSRTTDGRLMSGAQDNATAFYNGAEWSGIIGGDGMDNWIDPTDLTQCIGSSQYGSFARTVDGKTFTPLKISDEASEWTTPLVADYSKRGLLYTAFGNVYKSSDFGQTWKQISSFRKDSTKYFPEASALAVSASDSGVVMVCKRPRYERAMRAQCFRTSNGGASWSDVTKGLPDSLYLTSVEIADDNAQIAWVSCAGLSGANKVFRTDDGGQTWKNISYDLFNLPVNVLKQVPGSDQHLLLIGTDIGIYCTNDVLHHWIPYSSGLPRVIVTDIEVNTASRTISCSTFGRGIWSTDLITQIPADVSVWLEEEDRSLSVYPSPAQYQSTVSLQWTTDFRGNIAIEVIDIRGGTVLQTSAVKSAETLAFSFDNQLPAGSYVLRCLSAHNTAIRRFVVH